MEPPTSSGPPTPAWVLLSALGLADRELKETRVRLERALATAETYRSRYRRMRNQFHGASTQREEQIENVAIRLYFRDCQVFGINAEPDIEVHRGRARALSGILGNIWAAGYAASDLDAESRENTTSRSGPADATPNPFCPGHHWRPAPPDDTDW